jgi:glycosyltransferase involved in cell wall biosynthesis
VRILHIDTGAGWRGGQQQVLWLMEALRKRGVAQALLAPADSPLAARVRSAGLDIAEIALPAMSWTNLGIVRKARAVSDIVHAHDARAHSLAAIAAVGAPGPPRPLVVSRRVAFPVGPFGQLKYSRADAYIAVSDYVRQRLLDAHVPAGKIRVIFDGVPPPLAGSSEEDRAAFRSRHGADQQTFLIGTLTSLAPEKLLEAELDLLAELPTSVRFWMAIPAAERAERTESALREYARSRGVEQQFRIITLDENTGPFLAALDVFVYLSKLEGLGSAILLAMAHGLPVVASRAGGIPEIVRDEETGLLAGPNPGPDLAEAARRLIESPDLRRRLGAAARAFVLDHASCDRMAAQTAAVYEELLQRNFRPSRDR